MGRGEVQLMNDDGIDSHVPPLLSPLKSYHSCLNLVARANLDSSFVLNAQSSILTSTGPGFFVPPVRRLAAAASTLYFDSTTKEIFVAISSLLKLLVDMYVYTQFSMCGRV